MRRFCKVAIIQTLTLCVAVTSGVAGMSRVERQSYLRPRVITFPESAPYSPQIAALGKKLFFDQRLSNSHLRSCASCHNPSFGWSMPGTGAHEELLEVPAHGSSKPSHEHHDEEPLKNEISQKLEQPWTFPARNEATFELKPRPATDLAFATALFWDGRVNDLEEQVHQSLISKSELNASVPVMMSHLREIEGYVHWFNLLFPGEGLNLRTVITSIATYERTIISGITPFDIWMSGDASAIPDSAQRGFELFTGRARCSSCHSGWTFSDYKKHNIGLPATHNETLAKNRKYTSLVTPGLRNVKRRAPYMHNGTMKTLRQVLLHYNSGGTPSSEQHRDIEPLNLSDTELQDLEAFLLALTEERQAFKSPVLPSR
ncbi:MAG: tryptophan tryptophylquinone biosynthesis enzyme MauG [Cohaesibacteraceae bacterium]|nr:tryptophan tryptophylquinone biosynthesis enzyme MauG [Cohaesibacteraceae bacterium]